MSAVTQYFLIPTTGLSIGRSGAVDASTGDLSFSKIEESLPSSVIEAGVYTESINSPPKLKQLIRVAWRPRKWVVKPPPYPYQKKMLPVPSLKPRRATQSDKSWARAVSRFERLRAQVFDINFKRDTSNWRARQKYHKRLKNYERLVELQKTGYLAWKKPVQICATGEREDHPYKKVVSYDLKERITTVLENCDIYAIPGWWLFPDWTLGHKPYVFSQGLGNITQYHATADWSGLLDGSHQTDLLDDVDRTNRQALNRLLEKVKNQDVSLGEMTGERHQSWMMLKDLLGKFKDVLTWNRAQLIEHATQGKRSLSQSVLKEASNSFLMWTYGILPLVKDIQALLKWIADTTEPYSYVVVHGSAKHLANRTYNDVHIDTRVDVRYVVRYRVTNPVLVGLNQLGLVSPLEIGWELTKWSFLIDWVFNIGQYIDQLGTFTGVEFHSGTKATKTTEHISYTSVSNVTLADTSGHWKSQTVRSKTKIRSEKVRELLTDAPTPLLPEFRNPFSAYHFQVIIALIIQRLKF